MMRAMYAGVAGLKTHQTKMDVIGNNIANVNTVAFKSSSTAFSELMYQNVSGASGPTANGRGGVNAKQIGLGVTTASTSVNIASPGSTQTTGDGFDLAITGDSFFVVNNGSQNLFTKAGSFYVDGAGNLAMKSTGYNVMGWQVDPNTGDIRQDTVSPLRIMTEANLTSPPEATTNAVCAGVLDRNSTAVNSDAGYAMSLNFYDALGYEYTAKFAVKATDTKGEYNVELVDIQDSNGTSIVDVYNVTQLSDIVSFGDQKTQVEQVRGYLKTGVTYTPGVGGAAGTYRKELTFPSGELCTDFDTNKVPGFSDDSYQFTSVTGGQVRAHATTNLSSAKMEELYGVIYVPGQNGADGTYYKDGQPITTNAQWITAMGLQNAAIDQNTFQVTKASDGTMTFGIDQTFTLVQGAVQVGNTNTFNIEIPQAEAYNDLDLSDPTKNYEFDVAPTGDAMITIRTVTNGNLLRFDVDTGLFASIDGMDQVTLDFNENVTDLLGNNLSLQSFSDISIDFTTTKWYDNGGSSTMGLDPGDLDGMTGKGKKMGDLIGLSVSNDGTIWASYDNGNTTLLGQIAVAVFPNPSGLEKLGENCYQTTLNSGDFDGIGQDISADGGKMTSGVLEMSNVDLSTEFTEMITTQRGFQANSRIITTSDTLLEELINLKR